MILRALVVLMIAAMAGIAVMLEGLVTQQPPSPKSTRAVETPVVKPGGNFVIHNGLTTTTSCSALIYRSIFDASGTRIFADSEYRPGSGTLGENRSAEIRTFLIPYYAAPGRAEYNVVVEWQCNFIQRLWPQVRELPDLYFEIRP
jgi:hypothetical protein